MGRDFTYGAVYGAFIGGIVMFCFASIERQFENIIPFTENVQEGYVNPSRLEIKLEDKNNDKKYETLLNYNGVSYLLKVDENSRPFVSSYEIKPAEMILK